MRKVVIGIVIVVALALDVLFVPIVKVPYTVSYQYKMIF